MTIPKDVLRFEILLYASLLLDALSAAFFGAAAEGASEATLGFLSLLTAVLLAGLTLLVWLAARHRKNWARWTLVAMFALTLVTYAGSLNQMTFGLRALMDLVSLALSVAGFFFSFTAEARDWFKA
jgi:hypothetical protein